MVLVFLYNLVVEKYVIVRLVKYLHIRCNKRFFITERLMATRVGLLKEAPGKYGERNVWTADGCSLYKENKRVFLYKK